MTSVQTTQPKLENVLAKNAIERIAMAIAGESSKEFTKQMLMVANSPTTTGNLRENVRDLPFFNNRSLKTPLDNDPAMAIRKGNMAHIPALAIGKCRPFSK